MKKSNVSSVSFLCLRRTFTVLLGDDILFEPCGDSPFSNLIYTNSKEVFEQCIPASNVSADVMYTEIGKIFANDHVKFNSCTDKYERERQIRGE